MRAQLERLLIPIALLLVCATCVVATVAITRLKGDEHTACKIQQRALPADRQISGAWADLEELSGFSLKDPKNLALAKKNLSPQTFAAEVRLTEDFTRRIAVYRQLTADQPQTRRCAF